MNSKNYYWNDVYQSGETIITSDTSPIFKWIHETITIPFLRCHSKTTGIIVDPHFLLQREWGYIFLGFIASAICYYFSQILSYQFSKFYREKLNKIQRANWDSR